MSTTDCHSPRRSGLLPKAGGADPQSAGSAKPSRLWLWFIAAFAFQLAAWTTWFFIASHHKVAEVPLDQPSPAVSTPRAR